MELANTATAYRVHVSLCLCVTVSLCHSGCVHCTINTHSGGEFSVQFSVCSVVCVVCSVLCAVCSG